MPNCIFSIDSTEKAGNAISDYVSKDKDYFNREAPNPDEILTLQSAEKIPFKKAKTTFWSGGETNELAIYPKTAKFDQGKGNFDVRVSIASVENSDSTFTSMPGVNRILVLLDGKLSLEHTHPGGSKSYADLKPFDQQTFKGDWKTKGKSDQRVTDFNVMWKGEGRAQVTHKQLLAGETFEDFLSFDGHTSDTLNLIYVAKGACTVNGKDLLHRESLLYQDFGWIEYVKIEAKSKCEILQVSYKK